MAIITLNTHVLYPLPKDVSLNDPKALGDYILKLPLPAFFVVFTAHFGQALVGGYTAARLGGGATCENSSSTRTSKEGTAMILSQTVGALTLLGAVLNNLSLTVPAWTWIEMPLFPVMAWIAGRAAENAQRTTKNDWEEIEISAKLYDVSLKLNFLFGIPCPMEFTRRFVPRSKITTQHSLNDFLDKKYCFSGDVLDFPSSSILGALPIARGVATATLKIVTRLGVGNKFLVQMNKIK
jgi:hypothetical protein